MLLIISNYYLYPFLIHITYCFIPEYKYSFFVSYTKLESYIQKNPNR